MKPTSGVEKVAHVLRNLPAEVAEKVFSRLATEQSNLLRKQIEQMQDRSTSSEGLDDLLRELLVQIEKRRKNSSSKPEQDPQPSEQDRSQVSHDRQQTTQLSNELLANPVSGLQRLPAPLLAATLEGEHFNTISLVLNCLEAEKAGEVLKCLPPEVRSEATIRLSRLSRNNPELLKRIALAILHKSQGSTVQGNPANLDAKVDKLANMLRTLEKPERLDILAALDEKEPEIASRVKQLLYRFEDLLRIEDRSIQKMLSEIDSKTLALALKGAEEGVTAKVMNNVSKRARENLNEEMELLAAVPAGQVRQAQKVVVDLIQRLDQAGELVMQE